MSISLSSNFFSNARGVTFADGGGVTWSFNKNTNTLTAAVTSGGTLSSVGLSDNSTAPIYTVGNSPLAANGTLTITLNTQSANRVFAGPTTGATAQPAFRALVAADIPTITAGQVSGLATVATSGAYADLSGKPTIPAAANPTASVGLAIINGSAPTWMRSDGAPALNQGIVPTWTGLHTFSNSAVITATTGLALTVNGLGTTDTMALNTPSGRFTSLLLQNAGSLAAQFAWDNTNNIATLSTNKASASMQLQSGNGVLGLFLDASGVVFEVQPAPSAVNATATLTIAQLLTQIITSTTAAAVTGTLPTGTLSDAGIIAGAAGASAANGAFQWSVIATGANAFTVAAGVAHTLVGSGVVASATSGRFLTRKTAANTFVTYRLS